VAHPTPAPDGLSVVIPALDEERHLRATVETVLEVVRRHVPTYEILIFDDGSRDRTGAIADELAASLPGVQAFHHRRPRNLGGVFREGVRRARMAHVILINGKLDLPAASLERILAQRGQADLVIPYTQNLCERPLHRQIVSRAFTGLLNALFGLRLRYYNHSVLHRLDLVRGVDWKTDSYAFQAELVIKLLRRGCSYVEVAVDDLFRADQPTKAFRPRNVAGVARFLWTTLGDVHGRR